MKVKMLKTELGANDGIHVSKFVKGGIYNSPAQMSEKVKDTFLRIGSAEEYEDPEVVKRRDELNKKFKKADDQEGIKKAPQNKAEQTPKKKKRS